VYTWSGDDYGLGTNSIMHRNGKSKPAVWRRQECFTRPTATCHTLAQKPERRTSSVSAFAFRAYDDTESTA
jgi:hypothetical protein